MLCHHWGKSILLLVTLVVWSHFGTHGILLLAGEKRQESVGGTILSNIAEKVSRVFYFRQIASGIARKILPQSTLIFVNTGPDTAVQVEFCNSEGPIVMELTTNANGLAQTPV